MTNKPLYKHPTIDFGVPTTTSPHHFNVHIPAKTGSITITENLGFSEIQTPDILRSNVTRTNWNIVKTVVQRTFNNSLKQHKLQTSKWKAGDNLVDRLLGKELCVLAWSIERSSNDNTRRALQNWCALRQEDRWWLFGMADRSSSWKIALGYAFGATNDN